MGLYDYGARWYDPATARWGQVDPLADQFTNWSPYNYVEGNPILNVDPTGMSTESTHIDDFGNIIAEYDDGDDGVYVHEEGTTEEDVSQQREDTESTGGDGDYIGDLGGVLDVSEIYSNLLRRNTYRADLMYDAFAFRDLVKNGGDWDYKNNKGTIFGLGNDGKTMFRYNGMMMEAQDIGNHHFGAVAKDFGFPLGVSLRQAGKAQMAAGTSRPEWQRYKTGRGNTKIMIAPYGDDPRDQRWIRLGYEYVRKKGKR